MGNIKHSITMYGFGTPYIQGIYSLEDVLAKAKKMGGDGVEIVAPQMVAGHPNPTDEWIDYFKDALVRYELEPVCYSVYVDSGKHKDRFLTEGERFAESIHEMETAKRLGFKIVRSQDALLPKTLEKLIPYAEELGLHLAIELHGPWAPSSPIFEQYYEVCVKHDTDTIGFVPDFSAFSSGAPETIFNTIPDDLIHKDILLEINDLYATTEIPEEELDQMILDKGGDDLDVEVAHSRLYSIKPGAKMGALYYRTHPEYDGFRRLLKYTKYIHGKFQYCNENLECKGIDYPSFVKIMKEEGYEGYVCSEFEGLGFDPTLDDEEQITRHIRMLDKLWEEK